MGRYGLELLERRLRVALHGCEARALGAEGQRTRGGGRCGAVPQKALRRLLRGRVGAWDGVRVRVRARVLALSLMLRRLLALGGVLRLGVPGGRDHAVLGHEGLLLALRLLHLR